MFQKQTRSASLASCASSGSTASSMGASIFSNQSSVATHLTYTDPLFDNPVPDQDDENIVLPCEFVGLRSCDRTFQPDDTDSWIEHIINDHLGQQLPVKVLCLFCDDFIFEVKPRDHRTNLRENFKTRMRHIRDHIVHEGQTVHGIRPDYYMLEHLHEHRLISGREYIRAKRWCEKPSFDGIRPPDFVPPERQREQEFANRIVNDQQAKEDRARLRQQRKHPDRSHRH
ncbi:hypothetical protein F5X99DRAFT_5925 [Biscogniauxia marginata]|nr:hypothetical protein F5X99DRAFT_5925 [Biscogniauxia marginata]